MNKQIKLNDVDWMSQLFRVNGGVKINFHLYKSMYKYIAYDSSVCSLRQLWVHHPQAIP